MSNESGTAAILAALGANVGIAVTKLGAFALTGLTSMLAEGIHSLADSGNQLLLLFGGRRARRRPSVEHQFGYGRARYLYGFMVSVVLFSVGGLFALYEGYHKWQEAGLPGAEHPAFGRGWWWVPLVVLVVAIVLESLSLRTAVRESNRTRGDRGWVAFVRGAKAPELPVILLEDLAALIGLVLALLAVILSLVTANSHFDAVGTALIGVLLVVVAVILGAETSSLLLGESAQPQVHSAIADAIGRAESVDRVIHLRTLHLGPEQVLVAGKIAVPRVSDAAGIAAAIDGAERQARAAAPGLHLVIYLEPDLDRLSVDDCGSSVAPE